MLYVVRITRTRSISSKVSFEMIAFRRGIELSLMASRCNVILQFISVIKEIVFVPWTKTRPQGQFHQQLKPDFFAHTDWEAFFGAQNVANGTQMVHNFRLKSIAEVFNCSFGEIEEQFFSSNALCWCHFAGLMKLTAGDR